MDDFSKDQTVQLTNKQWVKIESEGAIAKGGQGALYIVNYGGDKYILKWYHSKSILANKEKMIKRLELLKTLSIAGFVFPYILTEEKDGQFGYIMEYLSKDRGYVPLSDFLYKSVKFKSQNARQTFPLLLAQSFEKLHDAGYSFVDLNPDNIFINVKEPSVKICDCDNISQQGEENYVKGKIGFIAPEIMKKENKPDIDSDIFSLSIILYMIYVGNDPFIGKNIKDRSEEETTKLYCDPVFVMDPSGRNAPDDTNKESVINNWNNLPEYIREAFLKTFIAGITNKKMRTSAKEWGILLQKYIDNEQSDDETESQSTCVQRYQPIFFIIDCSNSMNKKDRIGQVKKALNDSLKDINSITDTKLSINILSFSNEAKWLYEKTTDTHEISTIDLKTTGVYTNFNKACIELYYYLDKDYVLNTEKHPNPPLLILLSDGLSPRTDYAEELSILKENKWYKKSAKIAIGIDINKKIEEMTMLIDFVDSDPTYVLSSKDNNDLSEYIKKVTVTVTQTITNNEWQQLAKTMIELKG